VKELTSYTHYTERLYSGLRLPSWMTGFPRLEQPQTGGIDIVHRKRREEGRNGRTVKEGKKGVGPSFFHSPFVFPFVHFSYGWCQCLRLLQSGKFDYPRCQPRTTLYKNVVLSRFKNNFRLSKFYLLMNTQE
jgi:hypothetical protein